MPSPPPSSGLIPPARRRRSPWIGRGGGFVLLASAVILALGLALLANQCFVLGTINTSASTASSSVSSILNASATALAVIGISVLFVGIGTMLMYLPESGTAGEYSGDGLLVAGRVFYAIAILAISGEVSTVGSAVAPGAVSSSSISFPNFISDLEVILVSAIIGVVLAGVGKSLLSRPRDREKQIPRADRFQRIATYSNYGADGLYAVGVIFMVLPILSLFNPGTGIAPTFMAMADLFGYGLVFLALGAAVGGIRDLFHAYAFAELPPPVAPSPAAVAPAVPVSATPPPPTNVPESGTMPVNSAAPASSPPPALSAASATATRAPSRFCRNCGTPLRPEAIFCPSCGVRTKP